MQPDLERRGISVAVDGEKIVGHAIVYGSLSQDLGGFRELVRSGAARAAVKPSADVVALYNHDMGLVLGRTPITLHLTEDERGLAFELTPPNTAAGRDALELVRRGDVRGASFGFRTLMDAWRNDQGAVVRELLEIDIHEISLTAFPYYKDTDVAVAKRAYQEFQSETGGKRIDWLKLTLRV